MNKKALLLIPFFSLLLASCFGNPDSSSSSSPTSDPTSSSTSEPTSAPTSDPTSSPTSAPTSEPTSAPTSAPTSTPTSAPTSTPTGPTSQPTSSPTSTPTSAPTSSPTSAPTSAPSSSSTSAPEQTYTVTWKNYDGSVLEIDENVPKGTMPHYDQEGDPTRPADANAPKYAFIGWDKTPTQVTADVTYIAQYEGYAFKELIDDFEDYEVANELKDEGWYATTYSGGTWTKETTASLSLSKNSVEGEQSLRFNSFRNGMDFKINKDIEENDLDKLVNAVQFRLMTPEEPQSAKLLLNLTFSPAGMTPVRIILKHVIPVTSAGFVDYIIPFDDGDWTLWDNEINLQEAADTYGLERDRLPSFVTGFEIYLKYPSFSPSNYAAFLDSFSFMTTDNKVVTTSENLKQYSRYTGITVEGNTFRIDVEQNGDAIARIIDLETPLAITGKVTIDSDTNEICFESDTEGVLSYQGKLINDGQKIKYISVSGSLASSFAEMDLTAVQVLDNFDQYEEDGMAYYQSNKNKNNRSGLRGAYYGEMYTGSGSSDWGHGGWELFDGEGDQARLEIGPDAHSGNQYLSLKRDYNRGHRYMQWNIFEGTADVNSYRGSTFSFWAKTSGFVKEVTVYAFSNSAPTNINYKDGGNCKYETFSPKTLDEWTHFTINLNPNIVYYGFMILVEKDFDHSAETRFLVDDVEIYYADPYAVYIPYVPVTGLDISSSELTLITGETSTITATVSPEDATNKNVIWSSSNEEVVTVNNGVVTAVTSGSATITAVTEDGEFSQVCEVTVNAPSDYPTGTYNGTAHINGANSSLVIALGTEENGLLAVRIANADVVPTDFSYNKETHEFTITTTGQYNSMSIGNITGVYDLTTNKLTSIACDGDISSSIENNGEIIASKSAVWDCDGTTEELQQIFKRRYMSGGWQVDKTNADRITSNTEQFVSGTGSVKRRGWDGGAVALNFMNDFNPAKNVQSIQYWVYNPSGSDITLRMWYYQAPDFGSNGETDNVVAKAGQWTYISKWFGSKTIYNFQIADFNNTGVYLSFDNIVFF